MSNDQTRGPLLRSIPNPRILACLKTNPTPAQYPRQVWSTSRGLSPELKDAYTVRADDRVDAACWHEARDIILAVERAGSWRRADVGLSINAGALQNSLLVGNSDPASHWVPFQRVCVGRQSLSLQHACPWLWWPWAVSALAGIMKSKQIIPTTSTMPNVKAALSPFVHIATLQRASPMMLGPLERTHGAVRDNLFCPPMGYARLKILGAVGCQQVVSDAPCGSYVGGGLSPARRWRPLG